MIQDLLCCRAKLVSPHADLDPGLLVVRTALITSVAFSRFGAISARDVKHDGVTIVGQVHSGPPLPTVFPLLEHHTTPSSVHRATSIRTACLRVHCTLEARGE